MINLKSPQLSDKQWVRELLENKSELCCEYSFGNMMIWGPVFNAKIGRYKDFLIIYMADDEYFLTSFPMGNGNLEEVVGELKELAQNADKKLKFVGLTDEFLKKLESLNNFNFTFEDSRDSYDYVYLRKDLAELKGKAYKAKRNHISFFEKNNDWVYEEINDSNIDECFDMLLEWEKEADLSEDGVKEEIECSKRAFSYFSDLNFFGGLIRANGKVVAFTIAEKLTDDTADVHIEKAFKEVRGAYQIINREFARHNESFKFLNREDDNGSAGLRKSKLSYSPIMLKKSSAVLND